VLRFVYPPMARWTPSLVPSSDDDDLNVYLVVDDFGRTGRAYREAEETMIGDLLSGRRFQHR
jgi:hypothetical protein